MHPPTTAIIRRLSIAFILILFSTFLNAQIKIKERFEIGTVKGINGGISEDFVENAISGKDYFIIPRDGTIYLTYRVRTWANPLQSDSYGKLTVGGKEYYYTHFNLTETWASYECIGYINLYYYESIDKTFITVHKNDTLRAFIYSIENYVVNNETDDSYIYGEAGGILTKCSCMFPPPNENVTYWCYSPPERFSFLGTYMPEIMLGQSKYLQACWSEEYQEVYWAGADQGTFWSDSPNHTSDPVLDGVEFIVEKLQGNKPGIYWDQFDESGKPLPKDMLRIIGRYWNKDTTYVVNVKARYNGKETHDYDPISIEPPVRLLTLGQSPTYQLTRDVFNNGINIDSICIYYGGKYGIPPHFLKGHMCQEAARGDFGYTGFAPTYRYEPFTAQFWHWGKKTKYKNGPWFVDINRVGHEMGTGKDVPLHKNVNDMTYPRSPKTVWDIIYDCTELVNTGESEEHKYYGSRNSDGTMNFSEKYETIYRKYQVFLAVAKMSEPYSKKSVGERSREYMIKWLRDDWNNGAKNIVAQTRLASSYGLLQMMYSTAVEQIDYPANNHEVSPEDLNATDTCMFRSLEYMKKMLKSKLSPTMELNGNWPHGFEYYFKKYIWPTWNSSDSYPNKVYLKTQRFIPQNN